MATRLYFPATEPSAVTPAFYTGGGTYDTSEAVRRKLADVKGSSAITVGTQIGPFSGDAGLDRQYVSTRMAAGITFQNGVTTVKGQLMCREYANTDNVNQLHFTVRIFSEDGLTLLVSYTTLTSVVAEYINNATHRNKSISSTALSGGSDYTTAAGDRLVIDIAHRTTVGGTTPEASAKYGEDATDLPENETQTTDGAGWIEFSNTITFLGEILNPFTKNIFVYYPIKRASYW